jgi:hypothetical protein
MILPGCSPMIRRFRRFSIYKRSPTHRCFCERIMDILKENKLHFFFAFSSVNCNSLTDKQGRIAEAFQKDVAIALIEPKSFAN